MSATLTSYAPAGFSKSLDAELNNPCAEFDFVAGDLGAYIRCHGTELSTAPTVEPDTEPATTPGTVPVPTPDPAPKYVPGTQPTPDADPVPDQCPIQRGTRPEEDRGLAQDVT